MNTSILPMVEPNWERELKNAYTDPQELLRDLGLSGAGFVLDDAPQFAFRVPRPFAAKMCHGDADDPLLNQVLPLAKERHDVPGFVDDPNEELQFLSERGYLQKYQGRALVVATGGCAINCRYCFRRNFPYQTVVGAGRFRLIVAELNHDRSISEVILSGGDPLMLSDSRLAEMIEQLAGVSHVRRLRIHTRLPVTIPRRLTKALEELLANCRFDVAMVIHVNHPREIDRELGSRLISARASGISLLNQSVLLAGVNDNIDTLCELSETLFGVGVLPYYMHLLDPVAGSAHFFVKEREARFFEAEMRTRLSGYLVPKFVREIAGQTAKTPIQVL